MNKKDDGDSLSVRSAFSLQAEPNKPQLVRRGVLGLLALTAAYVAYLLIGELHVRTYVWQVTEVGPQLFPIRRTTCPLPVLSAPKALSIGVVYVFGKSEASSDWSAEMVEDVLENKRKYCAKHGYTLHNGKDLVDPSRPVAWSKLLAVRHFLSRHDYVLYIDMDAVIMNFDRKLEDFIAAAPSDADMIMTDDWNGPNTGVWLAKNTNWTAWFMDELFAQKQLVAKKSRRGIAHPFEYEQRAFHYLLQSDVWRKRGLDKYRGDVLDIRRRVHLLPQCSFNSYSLHPLDRRGGHQTRQYVPGDFVIHFAGLKGRMKVDLMKHYLELAPA